MKKRKKKHISTYKNWLLARDSACRINNVDGNSAFFESTMWGKDDIRRMEIFDLISGSLPFGKLKYKIFDFGMMKDAGAGDMTIAIRKQDMQRWFNEFIECLNPKEINMVNRIYIKISDELMIGNAEQDLPNIIRMKCEIPLYKIESDVVKVAYSIVNKWISESEFGKDSYQTKFFKWWMNKFLFSGNMYTHSPDSFEEALVEWMKVADKEDIAQAYIDLIKNSKNSQIKRQSTEIGTEEIINYVKKAIIEFNLDVIGVTKGTNMLSRFGLFDK